MDLRAALREHFGFDSFRGPQETICAHVIEGGDALVVMATGAAIGSPGTPGVGIVILATILSSVGIPPAGVAIILGVDRLLDMCRTAINVSGDMVACLVVDASHEDGEADAKPETAPS